MSRGIAELCSVLPTSAYLLAYITCTHGSNGAGGSSSKFLAGLFKPTERAAAKWREQINSGVAKRPPTVTAHVEKNSRPEAKANSPSSTPRQRQIKLKAASCLGHSLGQLAGMF